MSRRPFGAPDSDGDGLADEAETAGLRTNFASTIKTDPNDADTDDDGLTDDAELGPIGNDGKYGVGSYFRIISNPTKFDTDLDGLNDAQELDLETTPRIKDTDGDSLSDLAEISHGFDPLSIDVDGDTWFDDKELREGTDPFVYDFDLLGNVHSAFSGLIFGDAWDTDWARALNVNLDVSSDGWYLVGQLASGYLVLGDLRDMVYGVANGQWLNAAGAAVAFIPLAGDALRTVQNAVQFAAKSARAVFGALPIVKKLPKAQAQAAQSLLAKLPGVRLKQDLGIKATPPRANYDIDAGTWTATVRKIGTDPLQDATLKADLDVLRRLKSSGSDISDVRVNQHQVNKSGSRVGINRPDLQYTKDGKRYYVEYDKPRCGSPGTSRRGDAHEQRILDNDSTIDLGAQVLLKLVGACE